MTCLPLAWFCGGGLLGFPVLRLRGDHSAIVTLGFGETCAFCCSTYRDHRRAERHQPDPENLLSQGEGGWDTFSNFFGVKYDPSDRVIFPTRCCWCSAFVINRLLRMPLGRAWEALREDEIACRSGPEPTRIKLTAFTISAAFAGFAGTLFRRAVASSAESFTFAESAFVPSSCWAGWARSSR